MSEGAALLAVLGRAHPLLVHLPIGLVAALAGLELFARKHDVARARLVLATLTALCALATAGTGWLLGHAADRASTPTLELHQTLGLIVAGLCLPLALLARGGGLPYRLALLATLALLVPAGHEGSTLTHGEDWLLGPLHEAAREASAAAPAGSASQTGSATSAGSATLDYTRDVAPIFASRCGACHDSGRHKGGLVLLTPEGLRAGGRDGPVLEPGKDGRPELLRRLQLPLADDDHMPPEDKPQPLPPELATLEAWLRGGAPFGASSVQAPRAAPSAPDEPLPPAADPAALAALREALVHVEPLEPGSTLLWIDVAAVAPALDDAKVAALLAPVTLQVAELSLARAKVGDASLPQLARMPRLQRLDLRDTGVSSAGLRALAGHARLAELVLVRCKLDDSAVDALAALPALSRLHVWGAGLSPEALARLRTARPGLEVDADESAEAPPLEQEPAISLGAPLPKPVNMTCPVSGKPVDPAYQIVHEGRVIGFCCPHCPAQFWADPAKFKDKLP